MLGIKGSLFYVQNKSNLLILRYKYIAQKLIVNPAIINCMATIYS